jgi:uncharacterized 2Fe-2S/4Fe-4S cluster protein (DUF4445 family)
MMTPATGSIDFEPLGKRVEAHPGETLLEAARAAGIDLVAVCGGEGTCGQCRVQLIHAQLGRPTLVEEAEFTPAELAAGWRLACQTEITGPLKVMIPPDSLTTPQRLQVESAAGDLPGATSFSRAGEVVLRAGQPVGTLPAGQAPYGLAVDLGTTKIAAYLVDLLTGRTAAQASAMNPQISYGEDVISRILYCMEHADGQERLRGLVAETLNRLAGELCATAGASPAQILQAAVVGNTAMHHIFLGLPVRQLGLSPYRPALTAATEVPAGELGLRLAPGATVFFPQNIAGYVGGDHVAMLLATGAHTATATTIAIDIGTNTEVSLAHAGRIFSCSCASGPAFEGAHIQEGMRAAEGAIERVRIEAGRVHYQTIGGAPAVGICGSGILDAVAELLRAGVINPRGNLDPTQPHVRGTGRSAEFVLAPLEQSGARRDIALSRRDINEILLAKAAIQSGLQVLLQSAGIAPAQVERVIVAGAFGSYLDLASAVEIGMFPDLPLERFEQVGNAAGAGARRLLLSDDARRQAAAFARRAEYVELTTYPGFQDIYLRALKFARF